MQEFHKTKEGAIGWFYSAAATGDLKTVNALLEQHPEWDLARYKDPSTGGTPLHVAAENGHADIVAVLLAHKAEVNARNNLGQTPLHKAACYRKLATGNVLHLGGPTQAEKHMHRDVAALLLAHKAHVNVKDKDGKTPLTCAAWDEDLMALLLAHQADAADKQKAEKQ